MGIPFRPDAGLLAARQTRSFVRAVLAMGQQQGDATEFAKAAYPDDHEAHRIVQRTAVAPASTTSLTSLSATRISSLVDILGPATAAAAIFRAAMPVVFERYAQIWVPGVAASSSNVAFVLQGNPLGVESYDLSGGVTLTAGMKIGFISVLTREIMQGSNAEAVVDAKMREDFTLGVETLLLDSTVGSATRPAGLRYGVNKTTAATGGGITALAGDLSTLGSKVAAVGGNDIIFIAAAKEAIRAKCLLPASFPFPIYPSGGLSDGTLVAIAPRALCVASSEARLDVRNEVTLHMDTSPTPLSTGSTAAPIEAYPIRGLWQTDCVSIRLMADCTWGWRGAGIAWTDTVTW
jgi:hypothetical protein